MILIRAVTLSLAVALFACTSSTVAPLCDFSDFEPAPYDHLIEQLPSFQVAELKGRLMVRPRDVSGGVWPAGLDAKMELHGANGFREFIKAGDDGTFMRADLRPGAYCFKLSATGFRSAMGTLVVNRSAPNDPVVIELVIAE